MNDRQRFLATMRYEPRDRAPICDFGFWDETIEAWHAQGLPEDIPATRRGADTSRFFGMDSFSGGVGPSVSLCPAFETQVVEDRGEQEVIRDSEGVLVLRHKRMSSIPVHLGHLLTDRASWEQHFKPRLDPDTPERYPDWDELRRISDAPNYPEVRSIQGGSLYGWIRNWMGMENVAYLVYDDPALFEEMVVTLTDLTVEVHRRAFERGARFDACFFWEDMCYNAGPLLSPEHFKQYLVPNYRRITDQLRAHGCDVVWLDSDGCIDDLIPLWLDAGVNCMFPIEVGAWGGDPVKYRQQYGKDLLMMGGFDKHILARSPQAIDAEIERLTPVVEEGGFIPFCDHRVPPDVPLTNYVHYLQTVRRVWGKDTNLKPMGEIPAVSAAGGS